MKNNIKKFNRLMHDELSDKLLHIPKEERYSLEPNRYAFVLDRSPTTKKVDIKNILNILLLILDNIHY